MEMIHTVGRRKAAIARLYMRKGSGRIFVNGRDFTEYFPQVHIQNAMLEPFTTVELDPKLYDLKIRVDGGGFKGQAEAIRLAVARALVQLNEDYRRPLKEKKLLTRDAREVERKKYGKPKARKSFQFSKR